MDNEGLKNAIIRLYGKSNKITSESLTHMKISSNTIRELRDKMDSKLEELKINIIKSNIHLLVDKIHRGDVETSIKILDNTRDRTIFFDFISLLDELLILHEEYYQKLELECSTFKDLKDNLGINDHKLHKIIMELNLDN